MPVTGLKAFHFRKISRLAVILSAILYSACAMETPLVNGYALVYGISLYDPTHLENQGYNLTYSDDDAVSVSEMLAGMGYQVVLRTNSDATLENLGTDIADISDSIMPADNFVLYFSGHGGKLPEDEYQQAYREPSGQDADTEWLFLYGSLGFSSITNLDAAVSDNHLKGLLTPISTDRKILLLDACKSGGFIGSGLEVDGVSPDGEDARKSTFFDTVTKYFSNEERIDLSSGDAIVVAAAGEQEDSYEHPLYGHGAFTYHLLNTPSRGDANGDGYVTAGECYAYICGMLETEWPGPVFTPRISGGPVDFVLLLSR